MFLFFRDVCRSRGSSGQQQPKATQVCHANKSLAPGCKKREATTCRLQYPQLRSAWRDIHQPFQGIAMGAACPTAPTRAPTSVGPMGLEIGSRDQPWNQHFGFLLGTLGACVPKIQVDCDKFKGKSTFQTPLPVLYLYPSARHHQVVIL